MCENDIQKCPACGKYIKINCNGANIERKATNEAEKVRNEN